MFNRGVNLMTDKHRTLYNSRYIKRKAIEAELDKILKEELDNYVIKRITAYAKDNEDPMYDKIADKWKN